MDAIASDSVSPWQDIIAKSPGNARAYSNLGSSYGQRGKYVKAITYFQKAAALKPDMAEALFHLGLAHADLKHLNPSTFYYQKPLALQPANPEILYNLWVAYMSKGRMGPPAAAFQEALRLDPTLNQATMFLYWAREKMSGFRKCQDLPKIFNHFLTDHNRMAYRKEVDLPPLDWAFSRIDLTLEIHDAGIARNRWDRNGDFHHPRAGSIEPTTRADPTVHHHDRSLPGR
jgi:tetratricopeptide (TPR) repeat protein